MLQKHPRSNQHIEWSSQWNITSTANCTEKHKVTDHPRKEADMKPRSKINKKMTNRSIGKMTNRLATKFFTLTDGWLPWPLGPFPLLA